MMDASSTNLKLEAAGFGLGPFLDSNQTRHDEDIAEKWLLDDVVQPPDEGPLSKSKPLFALSKSNPLNGLSDHTYRALQYLAHDRDDFWALYECWVEKGQASLTAGFKTKKELKEAFRIYDKEQLGYISIETLKEILRELDNKLTEDDLDSIIEEVDEDGSGTLDFDEFMEMMAG